MRLLRALHRAGVLGINRRNAEYTLRWNDRRHYPRVDNKLETKRLCEASGIPTPKLLAVARIHAELRRLLAALSPHDQFVLKPAHGAMGNGILVIAGRVEDGFERSDGRLMDVRELQYHAAGIISGLYALGGQPDIALAEERLEVHPELRSISSGGVPDVRIVVYRGVPVMAMTRLPTQRSRGRANLHQGAVGVGIDLATGYTTHAVLGTRAVARHPDTREPVIERKVPAFGRALEIALRASDRTELGYVGADVVIDARHGPMILELNARPGLAIQVANRAGLLPRLRAVDASFTPDRSLEERAALGQEIARALGETAE